MTREEYIRIKEEHVAEVTRLLNQRFMLETAGNVAKHVFDEINKQIQEHNKEIEKINAILNIDVDIMN